MTDATSVAAPPPPTPTQQFSAEAVGTFVLVLIGLSSGSPFGFGVALFALVLAFGRISGGYFNPAVTVGIALAGRLAWKDAGRYVGAQLAGALLAGIVVLVIALSDGSGNTFGDDDFGAPAFGDRGLIDLGGALLIELTLAFVFVLIVLAITDARNDQPLLAPLGIGLAYLGVTLATLNTTLSVVNPAEALSTVFWSGGDAILQSWLFVLVPLLAAAVAALAYNAIFGRADDPIAGSGLSFLSSSSGRRAAGTAQWDQQAYAAPSYGYGQGGYAQQAQPAVEQPIIQDGWQWDPQAQQWIPAQQQAPQAPQQSPQQGWAQQPGDPDGRTQVRPPNT